LAPDRIQVSGRQQGLATGRGNRELKGQLVQDMQMVARKKAGFNFLLVRHAHEEAAYGEDRHRDRGVAQDASPAPRSAQAQGHQGPQTGGDGGGEQWPAQLLETFTHGPAPRALHPAPALRAGKPQTFR
jgi:hypothetical protein